MRRRAGAALAVAVAVAVVMWRPGPRGLLIETLLPLLHRWDVVNFMLDPHLPIIRSPVRVDPRALREQAAVMERDIEERFLTNAGRSLLLDTPPVSVGDVCLWQGVYAAAEVLRYRIEGSTTARARAEAAFDGLVLLTTRGLPIARAVYPLDVATEPGGKWFYRGGGMQWKEDASIDSASGWVFGNIMALEFLPTRKDQAAASLRHFADTLMAGGWRLRNSDGTPTRYSTMGGAVLNSPVGVLSSLAALKALSRLDGGGRYAREHEAFIKSRQDRWAAYASGPVLGRNKSTNHNIAFLALASAALTEDDAKRGDLYARGLVRLDGLTWKMGNSFWIYLTLFSLDRAGGQRDEEWGPEVRAWRARRASHLRRARAAMFEWDYPRSKTKSETLNSRRQDLSFVRWPLSYKKTVAQPLPVWQRPAADFVWQRSAYAMDNWRNDAQDPPQVFAPFDFLIAYYLGRQVGAFSPQE